MILKKFLMKGKKYIFLSLLVFLAGCAVNPVTGKRELMLMSESDEIRLGSQADKEIIATFGLYEDKKIAEYIDHIGQQMARISHRPQLKFYFRVLDSPVINAFALPGGYVYITRGILAYLNSEAELAGVVGHEIGHITARHSAKAYTRAQLAQLGFGLGSIFSPAFRQFSDIAQFGVGMLFLKFSRDQESQADELGVEYSTRVGYDATQMSKFFGTLKRLQQLSGQNLPSWFSTHPEPEDREATTYRLAKEWRKKLPPTTFRVAREPYLKLIDGIVFGEDPRQGFVEHGFFYHPGLDFQFPVPENWQVNNTPQEIQIVNKKQDAAILFTVSKEPSARKAADKFLTNTSGRLIRSNFTRVHGMPAEIRISDVTQEQGTLRVLSYFIEKNQKVFVFHGFCKRNKFDKYFNTFKHTMSNFDRLRNKKAKAVKPVRVKIITVKRNSKLETILKKHPSKKLTINQLTIMNGMELTTLVKAGEKIKVLTQ